MAQWIGLGVAGITRAMRAPGTVYKKAKESWPFGSRDDEPTNIETGDLAAVLDVAVAQVRSSAHDGFAQHRSTAEITRSLEELALGARQGAPDRDAIRRAFGPTGELQELSMANGWGEAFLSLGEQVDFILART